MPRRTLMVYRDQGYVSDTASELIKIVRTFNWAQHDSPPLPVLAPSPKPAPPAVAVKGAAPKKAAKSSWH